MDASDRLLAVSFCLMTGSLLLLLWAGAVGAAEPAAPSAAAAAATAAAAAAAAAPAAPDRRRSLLSVQRRYPPCQFSPLCSCSNSGPDLGLVLCEHVRLVDVPVAINATKVFSLTLRDNGLGELNVDRFFMARLWRLAIQQNGLSSVPERAFAGLERSLWQLDLSGNQLTHVPHQAIRQLSNLRLLDLSGNQISTLRRSDLQDLEPHLETVILADNYLRQVPAGLLDGLGSLRSLDMSNNVLTALPPGCLAGAAQLTEVNLAGNLLIEVPYAALADSGVHTVLLKGNLINDTTRTESDPSASAAGQLRLQLLDLSENRISLLPAASWANFAQLDTVILRGNQLEEVDDTAFESSPPIRELYMHDCALRALPNDSLLPLGDSLRVLDLGYNRLTELPWHSLPAGLQSLALNDNRLAHVPAEQLNRLGSLQQLNLLGAAMGETNVSALQVDLRSAGLSVLGTTRLTAELTDGLGQAVRDLYLGKNGLEAIDADAFSSCPILKHLDLSHNRIDDIDAAAFEKLGPSLESLVVFAGFTGAAFPAEQLQYLTSLKTLDFSGNSITSVPAKSFETMKDLRHLLLEHNQIAQLDANTFNEEHNPSLQTVRLSFNQIGAIGTHTFHRLDALEDVQLADNAIQTVASHAFSELEQLATVALDGNQITTLPDRVFSGLPRASRISLAYNQLTALNLDAFDQVGTLASLQLDVSHNSIAALDMDKEYWGSFTSFEYVDFSHNQINQMTGKFFETMRSSLTHASLAHNNIPNVTRDVFGFMPYIQLLDLSANVIDHIDYDAFRSAVNLQTLNVSSNNLTELPAELLQNLVNFRALDVSHNYLPGLPANLFRRTALQILRASHNNITVFPGDCLSRVGDSLTELDLSHNRITVLTDDLLHRLGRLERLNLAYNRIVSVEAGALRGLHALRRLDLSDTPLGDLAAAAALSDLQQLRQLRMANASLTRFPPVVSHTLEEIDVSDNSIVALRADDFENLNRLRRLDAGGNQLSAVDHAVWSMLSDLRQLRLAGNPFGNVSRLSLDGLEQLTDLDLADIDTDEMQPELLAPLSCLTRLTLSAGGGGHSLSAMLRQRPSLRHLRLRLNGSLTSQLYGELGHQLCNITISGQGAQSVATDALKDLTCHRVQVSVEQVPASLQLPPAVFQALDGAVRYVSLRLQGPVAVGRPSTAQYPGEPGAVFLTGLRLDGDGWSCDCSDTGIGWVEHWLSQWRHSFCPAAAGDHQCRATVNRLRQARCSSGKSVLAALSRDIQCHNGADDGRLNTALILGTVLALVATSAIY